MARPSCALGLHIAATELRFVALDMRRAENRKVAASSGGGAPRLCAFSLPVDALRSCEKPPGSLDLRESLRRYRGCPVGYHQPVLGEFLTTVNLPLIPAGQEAQAIRWEVQRLLPAPVGEYAVDFVKVGAGTPGLPSPPSANTYLVYGAPWSSVKASARLVRSLGLRPVKAFPGTVALLLGTGFLLRLSGNGLEDKTCMLVSLDENETTVIVSTGGIPVAVRVVDRGTDPAISESSLVRLSAELDRAARYVRRVSGREPDTIYITGAPEECEEVCRAFRATMSSNVVNVPHDLVEELDGFPPDGRYVRPLGLALSVADLTEESNPSQDGN